MTCPRRSHVALVVLVVWRQVSVHTLLLPLLPLPMGYSYRYDLVFVALVTLPHSFKVSTPAREQVVGR